MSGIDFGSSIVFVQFYPEIAGFIWCLHRTVIADKIIVSKRLPLIILIRRRSHIILVKSGKGTIVVSQNLQHFICVLCDLDNIGNIDNTNQSNQNN